MLPRSITLLLTTLSKRIPYIWISFWSLGLFCIGTLPLISQSTPFFAVTGVVKQPDGSMAATGLRVVVRNTSRQLELQTILGSITPGEYKVLFFNNGKVVANTGDTFKVTIIDGEGNTVVSTRHTVSATEITAGRASINLQIVLVSTQLSPTKSILTPPSQPAVADGKDTAIIRVELRDTQNKPIVGQKFLVTANGTDTNIYPIVPTNVSGKAIIQISTTTAEEKSVTVKLGETTLNPVVVSFVAGPPDPDLSTVQATKNAIVADGKDRAEISARLIDFYNNPVVGKKIGILINESISMNENIDQLVVSAPSDTEGRLTAFLSSKKAEIKTLTIVEPNSNVELKSRPVLTFVHGPAHQTRSSLAAETPTLADGESKSSVTITVLDQYGNPVQGATVTVTASGSENQIEQSLTSTDVKGNAIAFVSSTKAERKILTAKADGMPLVATTEIDFVATFLAKTVVEITPKILPADGHSTASVTVTTVDPNGNRITDRPPILKVTGGGKLSSAVLDAKNQVWMTTYTVDQKPGDVVISVLIDGTVQASNTLTLNLPDPNSMLIHSVAVSPKAVMTGEKLIFQLVGTPEGQARVSVNGLDSVNNLPLSEMSQGIYTAAYTVKTTDQTADAQVTFKLGELVNKTERLSVNIKGVPTTISFLGETSVRLGGIRPIRGQVSPSIANLPIELQLTPPDGSVQQSSTVLTDRAGIFSFDYTFDRPGGWLIEANYLGSEAYLSSSQSTIFITTLDRGKAILVLGGDGSGPQFLEKITKSVLETLAKRRLDPDNDIRFLTPTSTDHPATSEYLKQSIVEWAAPKVGEQSPLLIYLISPNLEPAFLLSDQTEVTPDKLAELLSVVPEETNTLVFVEGSYSGNFVTQRTNGKPALSALNRVIVTSTHPDRQNRIQPNGASFSTVFFDQILRNQSVGKAFIEAERFLRNSQIHRHQLPQIDANGNGIPNQAKDLEQAGQILVPADTELQSIANNPLRWATESQVLTADQQSIQIRVTVNKPSIGQPEIAEVWATIVPPSFEIKKDLDNWEQLKFASVELIPNQSEQAYSKMHAQFRESGRYLIFAYAVDQLGQSYTDLPPIEIHRRLRVSPDKPTVLLNLCTEIDCEAKIEQGSVFDLLVQVQNVAGLLGFEATLTHDPEVLEVLSVSEGEFLKRLNADTFVPTKSPEAVDTGEKIGRVSIAVSRLGTNGMSGAGTLAKVQFRAKRSGKTAVTFQKTIFSDAQARSIDVNLVDANIHIGFTLPDWDVNKDGQVNIFDLVIAANQFSLTGSNLLGDVNGDQTVNIFDIVLIGSHFGQEFGGTLTAPSHLTLGQQISILMKSESQNRFLRESTLMQLVAINNQLTTLSVAGSESTRSIVNQLINQLTAKLKQQTKVFQNYPNPFNPETWIPFQLTSAQSVQVAIYNSNGDLVRLLKLGELPAGSYLSSDRASYWDGRDQKGYPVASGVYFYQLQSIGNSKDLSFLPITTPRKMMIIK